MKNGILRQLLFLGLFAFMAETACAQLNSYRELHKVKRKETIFGIAKDNGSPLRNSSSKPGDEYARL